MTPQWSNNDVVRLISHGMNVQYSSNPSIYREHKSIRSVMEYLYPRHEATVEEIATVLALAPDSIREVLNILWEDGDIAVAPSRSRVPAAAKAVESGPVIFPTAKPRVPTAADYLGLEGAFKPLGNLVAPNEKGLSGESEKEVYEDVFGPARKNMKPGKGVLDL